MKTFLTTMLFVLVLGCARDDYFTPVFQVDEDLRAFIDTFLEEAAARGRTIDTTNLILQSDESLAEAVCGTCNSMSLNEKVQKIVAITTRTVCWNYSQQREALIYHELAHCILGRPHNNELLPNGDPKSMMVENDYDIYAPCVYQIGDENCNNTFKRSYYLDELFDESTPVPDWAK